MMSENVDQAIQKAKSIEIALSMNTGLSEYSLNNNYLKRTEGGSVPLKHNYLLGDEWSQEDPFDSEYYSDDLP